VCEYIYVHLFISEINMNLDIQYMRKSLYVYTFLKIFRLLFWHFYGYPSLPVAVTTGTSTKGFVDIYEANIHSHENNSQSYY
jgi:hypothetical protein